MFSGGEEGGGREREKEGGSRGEAWVGGYKTAWNGLKYPKS